jgi:hypothetical protein
MHVESMMRRVVDHKPHFNIPPLNFNLSLCPWPSGKGASLPSWTGGFDSRRALFIWVGSSVAEQVPVKHHCVGSSPARPFARCGVVSVGRNPLL